VLGRPDRVDIIQNLVGHRQIATGRLNGVMRDDGIGFSVLNSRYVNRFGSFQKRGRHDLTAILTLKCYLRRWIPHTDTIRFLADEIHQSCV